MPGRGDGMAATPVLVAPAQGSWLGGLAAACMGSIRHGCAVGVAEIKVPAPAKSQHLLHGRVVQGARGWNRMHGAGSACQAGDGAVAVVLYVGQEEPTGVGWPWGRFPGFSPVWACTGCKRCWFKSHSLGLLLEPISSK